MKHKKLMVIKKSKHRKIFKTNTNEVKNIIEMYVKDFELNNPKVGISTAGVVDSEKV